VRWVTSSTQWPEALERRAVRLISTKPRRPTWWRVLDHHLSARWCAVGWLGSCALFFYMTHMVGGVLFGDGWESFIPASALAHGDLSCMYAPMTNPSYTAPVYSLIAAGLSLIFRAGHAVPFPAGAALGPNCAYAHVAIYKWLFTSNVVPSAKWFAYVSWPIFVVGAAALLRTTTRARTWWEPVTALAIAATPPVLMSLTSFYHPEDLVCLGLIFGSLAAVRRERYVLAGIVLAGALLSQQFAILAAIPIVLTLPIPAAKRVVPALAGTLVAIVGVLALVSHGHDLSSLTTAGDTDYVGEVWIALLHVTGTWRLTLISRAPPIVLVGALALFSRRLPQSDATVPLLIAAGFALRLVFEVNLFPYYFMAFAVAIILADVVAGRVRPTVIMWLVAEWLLNNPFAWPRPVNVDGFPFWSRQVVFSLTGLALAVAPLVATYVRTQAVATTHVTTPTQVDVETSMSMSS
jgi:hypothetical protein